MTDLILRGGLIYDGLGGEPQAADIAITNDRIVEIGELSHLRAGRSLNVTGFAVSPGFIDIHTHSDFALLDNPLMESSLAQGVTTEVVGNCGMSIGLITSDPVFEQAAKWIRRTGRDITWSNMGEYLSKVEDMGIGLNVCTLAGHGTIRMGVLGYENRRPDKDELIRMERRVAGRNG